MNPEDPLVLTGLGSALGPSDPGSFLVQRRMRKFMGVQDDLAVVAAGRALHAARLAGAVPGERVGLYLAVGFIPFEARDIDRLLESSREGNSFSMARFSTAGMTSINPLLSFRCLPNMPAFHVSLNFELRGPYFITYPGPGQLYLALEQACLALEAGTIDAALLGGVASQRNFLVEHHLRRVEPPTPAERLVDAGGFMVLERAQQAAARGAPVRGTLLSWETSYRVHDPLSEPPPLEERFGGDPPPSEMGTASLPVLLAAASAGRTEHRLSGRDGIVARSRWELR